VLAVGADEAGTCGVAGQDLGTAELRLARKSLAGRIRFWMSETEAVEKENVVMRAGDCSVTILPQLGGKIASIRIGEQNCCRARSLPMHRAREP
jgi:hypothetical protein